MPHPLRIPFRHLAPVLCLAIGATGCSRSSGTGDLAQAEAAPAARNELFTRLSAGVTGVRFENKLEETRDLNVFTYRNYYNGGGVALGDLTGDGLPELLLTSNQGGPTLYLNRGKFHFRDITKASGLVSAKGSWTTGVVFADVNGDGKLDIYLCRAGNGPPETRGNELWINQGLNADSIPTFKEMAHEYG